MAMAMELAQVVQQERLAEAESRRRYKAAKLRAAQRAEALNRGGKPVGPKVEWPVFSLRIGRFQIVAFTTVRL